MLTDKATPGPRTVVPLIGLNLVPLIGVFSWGWQSFELIFLYWMENVLIGAFAVTRMLVRPYRHPLDLIFPLLFAPFFVFHYGAFCWGHGSFVLGLFAPEGLDGQGVSDGALAVLAMPHMLTALAALAAIQALDWVRDISARGLGGDGVKELMVAPYRRIVVLHLTILAGGFALAALDEPTTGLVILVLVKTASDIWHWRHDASAQEQAVPEITSEMMREIAEQYPEPMVKVNGREKKFASFEEMRDSREFRLAQAIMRLIGTSKELALVSAYLDERVRQERECRPA